ncbi:MAG: hypothetical protein JO023_16970 [Chloroflexi bacterium]|nr:hypothetical protein [Chloroflexota bacterium]
MPSSDSTEGLAVVTSNAHATVNSEVGAARRALRVKKASEQRDEIALAEKRCGLIIAPGFIPADVVARRPGTP